MGYPNTFGPFTFELLWTPNGGAVVRTASIEPLLPRCQRCQPPVAICGDSIVYWFYIIIHNNCIYIYMHHTYMSDCENPRFTERTFTNLGRSHRLPHVCTIMIYGKLGGYRLQCRKLLYLYIYIYIYI